MKRFTDELTDHSYDIIGISAIIPNIGKVKKMCELIRTHLPQATIVVGGHIANMPDLKHTIDADYICKGEGVRWFRKFLGLEREGPYKTPTGIFRIRHPNSRHKHT